MQTDQIGQLLEQLGQALALATCAKPRPAGRCPHWFFPKTPPSPSPISARSRNSFHKPLSGTTCKVSYRQSRKSSGSTC